MKLITTTFVFTAPVSGPMDTRLQPTAGRLTSRYGLRIHPTTKQRQFHGGIDLAAPAGTPLIMPFDGRVRAWTDSVNGNAVALIAADGQSVVSYSHMRDVALVVGPVSQGQIVGYVGSTGRSTGPHLHLEVKLRLTRDGKFVRVDPIPFMTMRSK